MSRSEGEGERQSHTLTMDFYPVGDGPYDRWEVTTNTGEVLIAGASFPVDEEAVRAACLAYHRKMPRPMTNDQTTTDAFTAGAEAMRKTACVWLRAQANAEYKLRPDGAARTAFVEAHNAVLKMPAPTETDRP